MCIAHNEDNADNAHCAMSASSAFSQSVRTKVCIELLKREVYISNSHMIIDESIEFGVRDRYIYISRENLKMCFFRILLLNYFLKSSSEEEGRTYNWSIWKSLLGRD